MEIMQGSSVENEQKDHRNFRSARVYALKFNLSLSRIKNIIWRIAYLQALKTSFDSFFEDGLCYC